ncbi:hypothetical protein K432DRAFT_337236 [Lepidopterella palustris CBS 459.81]|uniref:N-acetyltransferase domain-containing protein n=1 Tax=Lepidopterella palustris CBS 459.81 TaxID=1314670 RepID=A0A8E2JAP7_9PEZI|nr:hypothetical protein K432DRAFT_337236 [Lepidopterella palustris CBS 459.81]
MEKDQDEAILAMGSEPHLFDHIRLARLEDLDRIAIVAAAGFYHSPVFQFQRPYHDDYPEDTLASYHAEYEAAILDPNAAVLVAEDLPEDLESENVYEALRRVCPLTPEPGANGKAIVGVLSITLQPGSKWSGQLQPKGLPTQSRSITDHQQRDICPRGGELYSKATAPAKSKYLTGRMRLATLAVHPAYWHRGHGTNLTMWCTHLADLDGVTIGVSAAKMGVKVFTKAGFSEQDRVHIEGYRLPRDSMIAMTIEEKRPEEVEAIELWMGIRDPINQTSYNPSQSRHLSWKAHCGGLRRAWNRLTGTTG